MKTAAHDISGLSDGQKALWYLHQVEPDSTAYHLGICLKLTGSLDEVALASAWADIGAAHPQLRACFTLRDGLPSVRIDPVPAPMRVETGGVEKLERLWQETAHRPFALANEAPIRAVLLRQTNDSAHLLLAMHHIVADLWSSAVILRELSAVFDARASGRTPAVLHEGMAYSEFVAAEHRWLDGPQGSAAWGFWREQFKTANLKPIFTDCVAWENGGEVPVTLEADVAALVQEAARERKTTPYAVLLAGYAKLLAEATGREELIIGTPASIRDRAALRNTVGYLVNLVPVRCPVGGGGGDLVSAVAANARSALAQRRFPFPLLVERLRVPRSSGATPLFQSTFAFQSLPRGNRALLPVALNTNSVRWAFGGGVAAETVAMPPFDAQFPIALTLGRDGGEFTGRFQYDGRHVTAATASRLATRFPGLIRELLTKPATILQTLVTRDNGERVEHLFDEAARRMPTAIAVSEGGMGLTYAEVKARAERFAAGLDAALDGCDGPVALQMPSCAEAAILILAILKRGRAFQPVDPDEPESRRNAALRRTGACALLAPVGIDPGTLPDGVACFNPRELKANTPGETRVKLPSRTACFIFTSGSTGEPKAVEVGHSAVINHARAMAGIFRLAPNDRVLQFHTLAFDAAYEEIFPTWTAGARIVFEPRVRGFGVPALLELVAKSGVTVLNLPTSYWHTLTGEAVRSGLRPAESLRLLIVGGEEASERAYAKWRKLAPGCRWLNTYGPTEATITAFSYEPPAGVFDDGVLPIGRPIDGVTTLLMNDAGESITMGEGELLIGGAGLANGYRGDPGMTAAKFVTRMIDGKARRFYRTGDRVKLRGDGNFEFLGRFDRQLKIRGHRVDPGEIERILRDHPGVADAVVRPQEQGGELGLCGWIERAEATLTAREMRAHLSERLPASMVPARLTFVSRIPRKPNGKPAESIRIRTRTKGANERASGPAAMAALFSEMLGHKIGPDDDFFLCGGHSLLVIKLLGRVEARYGTRLTVSDFIAAPTARNLWKQLQAVAPMNLAAAPEFCPAETPVSAQQKRALLAHEIGQPSLANIVLLLRIAGRFDEPALARALAGITQRHPLLRLGFLQTDAGAVLREAEQLPVMKSRTLRDGNFSRALASLVRREGATPFALDGRAPWVRLLLVSAPAGRNRHLVVITHHAVADGWSFKLFLDELHAGYDRVRGGVNDSFKPAQDYRTYAVSQARWLASPAARAQAAFWKQRLAGAGETRLPFRCSVPADICWRIERKVMTLSPQLSRALRGVAASYGTTLFALAMACFKAQIHRYAGQSDIMLGTVVSNRPTEADQGVFGPLQNPALIRDAVTPDMPMRALARRVALSLAEAQDHGALPFERVIREALPNLPAASLSGGVQFLARDHPAGKLRLGGATVQLVDTPIEESPFELSIAVDTAAPRLQIIFEFQPTAHPTPGIKRLARHYAALLQSVAADPDARIGELNLIPANELGALNRRVSAVHRPRAELLHQGFKTQAGKNPNAPAITARGRRLTYGEINSISEATADALAGGGLKKGGMVAVMLPKGWEQITACLAVLKAGGVYVPVDPALPEARLKAVFEQGGFQAAIVPDTMPRGKSWARRLRSMVTIHSQAGRGFTRRPGRAKQDSPAYVIFTSGSTGIPKGVMISHQAAMTTIAEINRRFRVGPGDRVFAVSAPGFDLSVFDIFGTLRAGGTMVLPGNQDPKEWLEQMATEGVTIWNSAPCLFELLLDEAAARGARLEALRLILLSGDFISPALASRARTMLPRARLIALGGATEGAIWSIAREIKEVDPAWNRVPYGRALRGQEVFVLDADLEHCPAGAVGELFIAGAGVAEGYWRNRAETRRRFMAHPRWNLRLYRTGDQGRYLANGEIEILGRLDGQVKVNGVRIELGEIEAALRSLPSVRQAVAEVRADAVGNKQIVAFVASRPGTNASMLQAHARTMLPASLVPAAFVVLERVPLNPNGKVDRAALRVMALPAENSSVPPETSAARWIVELWGSLLGGSMAGLDDDFFALGGHSLLAIKMLQRVRSYFGVALPLSLIVGRPTVRSLAAAVRSAAIHSKAGMPRRAVTEFEHDSEPVISKPARRAGNENPDAVLLTGATGHLGSALLAELLRRTNERVYCLVRADSKQEAERRILDALQRHQPDRNAGQRIVAVPADLGRVQFGLEAPAFAALAASVRAAYHCAAEVSFIAPYEKLAASNVGGVREMIRLATAGSAVLHHVSSVAVFPYGGSRVIREDEDIARVGMLTGGYAQSKWAAERMVWKAISRGLRAVIYRPAQIVNRRNGHPPHDLFDHVLRACRTLKVVPDIKASVDMVTPEYAAAAIYFLSTQERSLGRAFHLAHPEPVTLRNFVGLLPIRLPLVPLEEWLGRLDVAAGSGEDPSLHFISLLVQGLERADLTPNGFDCSNTTAALRGTGVACPPLDRGFIQFEPAPSGGGA